MKALTPHEQLVDGALRRPALGRGVRPLVRRRGGCSSLSVVGLCLTFRGHHPIRSLFDSERDAALLVDGGLVRLVWKLRARTSAPVNSPACKHPSPVLPL